MPRLIVQALVAAACLKAGGLPVVAIELPGSAPVPLGAWGWAAAWLFVVGFTNMFNFMDGINGIAAITGIVGFGLLADKPVFILPGGPPSNLMGFLQIALPGLLRLAASPSAGLPTAQVHLTRELTGRQLEWTQFVFGLLEGPSQPPDFVPLRGASRLADMAGAAAVVAIPEGQARLTAGTVVRAQLLN